ncbi:DUF4397 domain-containing protein [Modestobacter sp. VKM Ac-2985]|uniref:DUF4397 domain-containing protein n=1 Tax=Modestobacter sp. VKM Ac-2985 TaxID=3004139 RepID=UPI0022AB55D1|nr:DUF4397 domain-containing protein [Modestobacter sp. VKM Ac-2985]MCZ2835829.1 DUF4397 domain-containing protein [Modestobacter sp. VKM Ac-2985]
MNKTRPIALTAGATGAFALLFAATPALADTHDTATVSVLHAVPETPVDVYANGEELISDFQPGTLGGPLTLPGGEYDLTVYPAGADPESAEVAISLEDVQIPAGANATVVAHLNAAGAPELTPFVNDTSAVPAGEGRLTVRHVAAAPAVDVRAGGEVVIDGLTNPNEESVTVPAGDVSADVVLAGTDTVAIGPADLTVAEGASTIVYAWGSEEAGYELANQTVEAGASAPSGVPGGSAGLAADEGMPAPLVGLTVAGLAAAAFAGRKYATSRV